MFELKIFVDCDADTRLARRVERDIAERGRTIETVLTQYTEFVKPSFEDFCLPTKKHADIIVPRGRDNIVAINLITHHVFDLLNGNYQQMHQKSLRNAKNGYARTPSKPDSPIDTKCASPIPIQINPVNSSTNSSPRIEPRGDNNGRGRTNTKEKTKTREFPKVRSSSMSLEYLSINDDQFPLFDGKNDDSGAILEAKLNGTQGMGIASQLQTGNRPFPR